MKILYLVTEEEENKLDKQTSSSIKKNCFNGDEILFITNFSEFEFENAYCKLNQLVFKKDIFDYICIIPNGSILSDISKELMNDYLVDTEKSFDRMLHEFKYRGLDDPSVYYPDDYTNQVMNHPAI